MSGADIVLTFLGTGATIPPLDRYQVSFALRHAGGLTLFDCGEGTQYSLRKFKISTRNEFVICISHLHSDHFLGLPGLLSSFQLQGRNNEIIIIGPVGMKDLVSGLLKANYILIEYPLKILEYNPGEKFNSKGYRIHIFKAKHEGNAISFLWQEDERPGTIDVNKLQEMGIPIGPLIGKLQGGQSIKVRGKQIFPSDVLGKSKKGRTVAYSGDTLPNENFIQNLPSNCDVLVHEGTYPSEMSKLGEERGHSTLLDAAKMANLAKTNTLVITHLSPRIINIEDELQEIKKVFPNTIIGYDGLKVIVPFKNK